MGYLPKHIKVRRQRWQQRVVATAALSGAVFTLAFPSTHVVPLRSWIVRNGEGRDSGYYFTSRYQGAIDYLVRYFSKQGIWPTPRRAAHVKD